MRWTLLLAVALTAGCNQLNDLTGTVCTLNAVAGLSVRVADSLTGAPVASGSTVRAVDGPTVDSVVVPANRPDLDSLAVPLVYERAGTYQVSVTRLGYQAWTKSNVTVRKGTCHVEPVSLTARLVRAP